MQADDCWVLGLLGSLGLWALQDKVPSVQQVVGSCSGTPPQNPVAAGRVKGSRCGSRPPTPEAADREWDPQSPEDSDRTPVAAAGKERDPLLQMVAA